MLSDTASTFPVCWDNPADSGYAWTFERMHAPEPMTLADGIAFECAFDHGVNFAARLYGVPLQAMTRRINTYLFLALVPTGDENPDGEARLHAAIGRLRELWERECLPEITRHLQHWEAFDPRGATTATLLDELATSVERTRRLYEIHFTIWFPFMAAISLFDDFYRELLRPTSDLDAYRLLQGFENKTVEGNRALWQLSRRALELPAVRAALEQLPSESVLSALESPADGRRFLDLLRDYLAVWGQRGERWGWSFPSWIEEPAPVVKTLKDYVQQPDRDLEAEMAEQVAERERLVHASREQLRGAPTDVRQRFEFLLDAAQQAIVLTEDHSHWIDFRCMYHLHRISMELGQRLVHAGVVDRADDVFLLSLEELREAHVDRTALIASRRAEMEHFRGVVVPPHLGTPTSGDPPRDPVNAALLKFFGAPASTRDTGPLIRGNRGSPGRAVGRARVVLSLAAASKLHPGDVLVVETTAPPWTPLFATAAAIVSDTGGILSHCAVVAREYRIPAVVGTGNATTLLRDGQLIEVDGDAGVVRMLP